MNCARPSTSTCATRCATSRWIFSGSSWPGGRRSWPGRSSTSNGRKLNLGLSTNFQLVDFEDDLVNVQNREVDAIISYLNALTRLDQTLGTTLETWRIDVDRTEQ